MSATDYDGCTAAVAKMIPHVAYYFLSVAYNVVKPYQPSSLASFSPTKRYFIKLGAACAYWLVALLGKTLRYEVEGLEKLNAAEANGEHPIYCFWHDRILAGTYYFRNRGIVVMTSQSEDGEYIARFIQRFGYGAVRGSSSRGGAAALVEMIRLARSGKSMAFTVDGPRGPRYQAKLGPVLLAKKTGDPMMPFILECRKYWQVKSWDRLQIPKPFSRVRLMIDDLIYVPSDANDDIVEKKKIELQSALDGLVDRGERWRIGVHASGKAAEVVVADDK